MRTSLAQGSYTNSAGVRFPTYRHAIPGNATRLIHIALDAIAARAPAKPDEAQLTGELSTGLPGDMPALLWIQETPPVAAAGMAGRVRTGNASCRYRSCAGSRCGGSVANIKAAFGLGSAGDAVRMKRSASRAPAVGFHRAACGLRQAQEGHPPSSGGGPR